MGSGLSCLFLTAMLFVMSVFESGYISLEEVERTNLPEHVVCSVESSRGIPSEKNIGYTDGFWMDGNETVYLLEPYENRVLRVQDGVIRSIDLQGCILPSDIVCTDRRMYIYDDLLSAVRVYDRQGGFLFQSDIVLDQAYVKKLDLSEEGVSVITYGGKQITISDLDGTQTIEDTKETVKIELEGFDYTEYLDTAADGTVYAVATRLVPDSAIIAGELVLCKLSASGELLDSYILPTEEMMYLPDTYIQVVEDGGVYLLVAGKGKVQVQQVSWTAEQSSALEEVKVRTEILAQEYKKEARSQMYHKFKPGVTRKEAWKRAQEICNYTWKLRKSNTRVSKSEPGVDLPREVIAAMKENEGKTSWKVTMKGIPYCWGGFDSPYGGMHGESFRTLIEAKGYVAGNINTTGYLKYYTAGLDCSGFVSAVLGSKKKMSTGALLGFGREIKTHKELSSMDILVCPGDHVIMFREWLEDGVMLVAEAAKRESKTVIHPKSLNEFVVNGLYQMRSPW